MKRQATQGISKVDSCLQSVRLAHSKRIAPHGLIRTRLQALKTNKKRELLFQETLNRNPKISARPEGFEPPTFWSVAKRSIQLSQGRIFNCVRQPNDIYYITPGALCQALRAIKSKLF